MFNLLKVYLLKKDYEKITRQIHFSWDAKRPSGLQVAHGMIKDRAKETGILFSKGEGGSSVGISHFHY